MYKIIEVDNNKTKNDFFLVLNTVYKNDKNYVYPLNNMVEDVFKPSKNSFYSHGKAVRWVVYNTANHPVGRIAAFINNKKAFGFQQPTGGMGFFEAINDEKLAFLLFDTAKQWLIERGMEAADAPINFGENENFWGLLVAGFEQFPSFGINYNPEYYKVFFEKYGFKPYFEQITNELNLLKPFPERFWIIAERVINRPDYEFKHFEWNNVDKFISDFKEVYDCAWQYHENFSPIDKDALLKSLKEMKVFLAEDFIWYVYYKDEPIAFLVMVPDINFITKYLKGKMNFLGKLIFFTMLKRKKITRGRILVMGVKPKYQRLGVESGIFWHLNKVMKRHKEYNSIELSWVGDFNPKMRALHESVGAVFSKKHITYRLLFNSTEQEQKAKRIDKDTKERMLREQK